MSSHNDASGSAAAANLDDDAPIELDPTDLGPSNAELVADDVDEEGEQGGEDAGASSSAAAAGGKKGRREPRQRPQRELPDPLVVPPQPKRLERPNYDAVMIELDDIDQEIKATFEQLTAERAAHRTAVQAARQTKGMPKELKEKIIPLNERKTELQNQLRKMKEEKQPLQDAVKELVEKEKRAADAINQIRKNCEFRNLETLEKAISQLEEQMNTGSIDSVSAEEQTLKKIRRLKEFREPVVTAERESKNLNDLKKALRDLRTELNAKRDEMEKVYQEAQAVEAQIQKLKDEGMGERNVEAPSEDAFVAKMEELRGKIEQLKLKKKQRWADFKEAREAHRKAEDDYYDWVAYSRQIEAEIARRARVAALESRREEIRQSLLVNPHEEDTELVDAMILYLSKYMPETAAASGSAAPAAAGASSSSSSSEAVAQAGLQVLKLGKSKDEEVDALGYLNDSDFQRNKGGKGKKHKQQKPKDEVITHTLERFNGFNKLKVAAPLTKPDVPAAIEALKKRRSELETWTKPTDEELDAKVAELMKAEEERANRPRYGDRGDRGGRGGARGGGRGRGRGRGAAAAAATASH